jgi:hypothetical protein
MTALFFLLLSAILLQVPAAPTNPNLSVLHVVITAPTANPTYNAGSATELTTLAGTATSSQTITVCTWTNSLGGGGSATGTTSWSVSSIALADGDNVITVTCTTNGGVQRSDVITVSSGEAAGVSVNLTVQEALYDGGSVGVNRTNEPVVVGVPLPDGDGCETDTSNFGLTGASYGQFRVLGTWDSGCIKWVQVATLLGSLSAGAESTAVTLTNSGSGNFGASNMATDTGSTLVVDTGPAEFTIKEANYNGFDIVVIDGATVVSTGGSGGPVLTGPTFSNTRCGSGGADGPVCSTIYAAFNDDDTACTIEQNGPVLAVIKCEGALEDSSNNIYMRYTDRLYFYQGKKHVKVVNTLRNADDGSGGSFATAYKGMAAYEWRVAPNISGTRTYDISEHGGNVENGTISGTDDVYLYQAKSLLMESGDWGEATLSTGYAFDYTTTTGYTIEKTSGNLGSGTSAYTNAPGGWADIRDSGGKGVTIGFYQMAAYWPKSLEFNDAGSDTRLGIWPRQNVQQYYQAWPQWSTHDLYFNFHDEALASPGDEFLKFQHELLARASVAHYNSTQVFPLPLPDATEEENYYKAVGAAGVPTISAGAMWPYPDPAVPGTGNAGSGLHIHRAWAWPAGGGGNQMELRWSGLMNWIVRGYTGRYLYAKHFYRFQTDDTQPHSDGGFHWRDKTSGVEIDVGVGRPRITSTNGKSSAHGFEQIGALLSGATVSSANPAVVTVTSHGLETGQKVALSSATTSGWTDYNTRILTITVLSANTFSLQYSGSNLDASTFGSFDGNVGFFTAFTAWTDSEHAHVYGMGDYYFMSGDELIRDSIVDTIPDYLTAPGYYTTNLLKTTTRAWGVRMINNGRWLAFLKAIGEDTEAENISDIVDAAFPVMFATDPGPCPVSSETALGCTAPSPPGYGSDDEGMGVDITRGIYWNGGTNQGWVCDSDGGNRAHGVVMSHTVVEGLINYSDARGTGWSDYWKARDYAYGISQGVMNETLAELWYDNGSDRWDQEGPRPWARMDLKSGCGASPDDSNYEVGARTTIWYFYYVDWLTNGGLRWKERFDRALQVIMGEIGLNWGENGSFGVGALTHLAENPGETELQDVYINTFTHLGSGTYRLQWAVPDGTTSYRIKWSDKEIVDWIGFDTDEAYAYVGDPTTQINWFAATNVDPDDIPTPGAAGSQQSITIATGDTGLTLDNFSVKAYYPPAEDGLPSLTWSTMSLGGDTYNAAAQIKHIYDDVSGQILTYIKRGTGAGIYSTDYFALNSNTEVLTRIGGTGSPSHGCVTYPNDDPGVWDDGSGSDIQPWLSDRHPDHRSAILNGYLWQSGGLVCGDIPNDLLRMELEADPTDNTTAKYTPANDDGQDVNSSMASDPTHEVLLLIGTTGSQGTISVKAYCPVVGSLTAAQTAAGCSVGDTWETVYSLGVTNSPNEYESRVAADTFYDATLDKVLIFKARDESSTWSNEVWEYDVESKTMTQASVTGAPSNLISFQMESLTVPIRGGRWKGKYLYIRTSHHLTTSSSQSGVWLYDPVARSYTAISTSGTGPELVSATEFDPSVGTDGAVISLEYNNTWRKGVLK